MVQLRASIGAWILACLLGMANPIRASVLCATVMDYARLPLPNASLNATNLLTGKSYTALADRSGHFCFSNIPEGLFSIDASLAGFLHVKYYPVRVAAGAPVNLSFQLPFGEITEGGIGQDATISGTLLEKGSPAESAKVCAIAVDASSKACTATTDLGEYAIVVPVGVYQTEVQTRDGRVYKSKLTLRSPGIYRNRISVDGSGETR